MAVAARKIPESIQVKVSSFLIMMESCTEEERVGNVRLVVPQSLIKDVIAENHNPKFVANHRYEENIQFHFIKLLVAEYAKNQTELCKRMRSLPKALRKPRTSRAIARSGGA
jgi:hypothetical protein